MSVLALPKFLKMPAIGFDISTDAIRFIELIPKGAQFRVGKFGEAPLLPGIVVAGSVHDPVALAAVIKEIAHKNHIALANVALPEDQAFLAHMEFPRVSPKDVRTAVEMRLEEYVPVPPQDATFDYVMNAPVDDNTMSVTVGVLPSSLVEQYVGVFEGTGITPKNFELQSQAMARAIFGAKETGTYMGIDIGKDITTVFISNNRVVQFSSILDVGGDSLTQAISKKLVISEADAEIQKSKYGLIDGVDGEAVKEAMLPILEDLRAKLLRHFAFWQSRHEGGFSIERVVLTGGGANLKGITEFLGQGVRAPMITANPWVNVCNFENYLPPISMHLSQGYSAAIGLALLNGID